MTEERNNPSTAPGPAAGYLFQPVRALYWLAKGDAATAVGIETEDDITILKKDGGKIREQDKSSIRENGCPYGDKSDALWNTLRIWARAIKSGEIDVDRTEFFLITNKAIPDESLVRAMSLADHSDSVANCLMDLQAIGWSIPKESTVGKKVEEVLSLEPNLLRVLIQHTHCDTFASHLGEPEKRIIVAALHLTDQEQHDMLIESLLGWISRAVLDLWEKGQPGWVKRASFDNQLEAVRGVHRRRRVRASCARELHVSENERQSHAGELFVKQAEIICLDKDAVYDAVTDYVRFGKERLRLAREGNVTEEDWGDFDDNLLDQWKIVRGIEKAHEHKTPEMMGQVIYYKTMAQPVPRVGELETELYLVRGGYHNLANALVVGWHPEYRIRLSRYHKGGQSDETINGV